MNFTGFPFRPPSTISQKVAIFVKKEKALDDADLLERVASHKSLYFASNWANYGAARKGTLKLFPPNRISKELERDYTFMRAMFFREIPEWKMILQTIDEFEKGFNNPNT